MPGSYSPVDPDFEVILQKEVRKEEKVRIHFFNQSNEWDMVDGIPAQLTNKGFAVFLTLRSGAEVRIDRIITINGKPGPKIDEFESYGNACLDCNVEI